MPLKQKKKERTDSSTKYNKELRINDKPLSFATIDWHYIWSYDNLNKNYSGYNKAHTIKAILMLFVNVFK